MFSGDDFAGLRGLLAGLQGRFILSINDVPAIRDIFAGFAIEEAPVTYLISRTATPARELIITAAGGPV